MKHPVFRIAAVTCSIWLVAMVMGDRWHLFADNYFMSITMMLGSFIAGATSEGGGAVAFPVMTLVFGIAPATARDFALMIQAVGMSAASITILASKIPIEGRLVGAGSLGGAIGVVVGIELISPHLPPPFTKMFFTSFWLAFAVALFMMNRARNRTVHQSFQRFGVETAVLIFFVAIVGGMVSGLTGSGLDIVLFSLAVLAFRLDERVATPTSVLLMAGNAMVGFLWKGTFSQLAIPAEAWGYWWVCIPVVVVGAPMGARFIRGKSRHFVATILYTSIAMQYIAALLILPMSLTLLCFSVGTFAVGLLLFSAMARIGARQIAAV